MPPVVVNPLAVKTEVLQPGLEVVDITAEMRKEMKIPVGLRGARVTKAMDAAGMPLGTLSPGEFITAVNGQEAKSAFEVATLFHHARGSSVMLRVWKQNEESFASVTKTPTPLNQNKPTDK